MVTLHPTGEGLPADTSDVMTTGERKLPKQRLPSGKELSGSQ